MPCSRLNSTYSIMRSHVTKTFCKYFFLEKKFFLKYLHEPCLCLLITKPLDLITIYLHVEKRSHWHDWYYIFLTLVGHQSPHAYWAPTLCQVEVGSGDIRESLCPERACIAVVTLLFTRIYTTVILHSAWHTGSTQYMLAGRGHLVNLVQLTEM